MQSIRRRLLTGTLLGSCALALLVGAGFYYSIRSILITDFNETLIAKARAMAALVEEDEGEIEAEFASYPSSEFTRKERPEYYFLRNTRGDVLARSPSLAGSQFDDLEPKKAVGDIALPDGRPGRYASISFQARTEGRRRPTQELVLVVARDVLDLKHTLRQLQILLVGIGGAGVLGLCVLMIVAIRSGLMPLNSVATQISRLDAASLAERLPVENVPEELVPVVGCLNDLLGRLEGAFARERAFTADVAHDLRTPLAGLRSTLEVAISKQRDANAYREAITQSLGIAHEMQGMVTNLLTLVRAEAGQLAIAREPVDVQALLREAWATFATAASSRNLDMAMIVPAGPQVLTDRGQISLVLHQLFENAVTYTNEGGEIRLEAEEADGRVRIRVSNTGNELNAEDTAHVFERFWRGDKSRATPGLHCGLGLSLAKRVTELLGGTIGATVDGNWFVIEIELPK